MDCVNEPGYSLFSYVPKSNEAQDQNVYIGISIHNNTSEVLYVYDASGNCTTINPVYGADRRALENQAVIVRVPPTTLNPKEQGSVITIKHSDLSEAIFVRGYAITTANTRTHIVGSRFDPNRTTQNISDVESFERLTLVKVNLHDRSINEAYVAVNGIMYAAKVTHDVSSMQGLVCRFAIETGMANVYMPETDKRVFVPDEVICDTAHLKDGQDVELLYCTNHVILSDFVRKRKNELLKKDMTIAQQKFELEQLKKELDLVKSNLKVTQHELDNANSGSTYSTAQREALQKMRKAELETEIAKEKTEQARMSTESSKQASTASNFKSASVIIPSVLAAGMSIGAYIKSAFAAKASIAAFAAIPHTGATLGIIAGVCCIALITYKLVKR